MNDELIKRIDEWQSKLDGFDYFDGGEAERLLADCRAALSRKYVPMTDEEWKKLYTKHELMAYDNSPSPSDIEAEVIRRAGLEIEK